MRAAPFPHLVDPAGVGCAYAGTAAFAAGSIINGRRSQLSPSRLRIGIRRMPVKRDWTINRMSAEEDGGASLPQVWASSISTVKELAPAIAEVSTCFCAVT